MCKQTSGKPILGYSYYLLDTGKNALPKILFIILVILLSFSFDTDAEITAEQRFYDSVKAYRSAEEKFKKHGMDQIDVDAFKMVIQNLERAIPDLHGVMLGRALVLDASCYLWLYNAKMLKGEAKFFDLNNPDPLLQKGLPLALRGRKILEELGSTVDLPWANDVVQKLGGK